MSTEGNNHLFNYVSFNPTKYIFLRFSTNSGCENVYVEAIQRQTFSLHNPVNNLFRKLDLEKSPCYIPCGFYICAQVGCDAFSTVLSIILGKETISVWYVNEVSFLSWFCKVMQCNKCSWKNVFRFQFLKKWD